MHAGGYQFGAFTAHPGQRALLRDGVAVEIGSRALDVLFALLRLRDGVATKTALMEAVWPGRVVEENNLTTQIATLRRILGDGQEGGRFINTLPGRGYRWVCPTLVLEGQADASVPDAAECARAVPPAAASGGIGERHNLPLPSSSFIGRADELAALPGRIASRPLLTLTGAGGVGKTRLALQLASQMLPQFADGVLLVELAPLDAPGLLAETLCRLLGIPPAPGRAALDAAIAMLRQKALLLVLDNCEHLLGAAAEFAALASATCPGLRILATSREALGVSGEAVYPLPSLAVPGNSADLTAAQAISSDAVRLFVDRAVDSIGRFDLTDENAGAVATICRRLDGMPLATELAAARLRALKPAEIAARLEHVFHLLTGGSRNALPRQQTLHATIQWSVDLLDEPERMVLRRLSVFVDGCTLEGASAVCSCGVIQPAMVFDLLDALVGKSLVVADTSGRETRYRMLETTRQFAAELLRAAGEGDRADRMASHMLELFTRAEAAWPTTATAAWLAEYAVEAENLRAAIRSCFDTGQFAKAIALVAVSGAIADEASLQPDLRRWTQAALPHLAAAGTPSAAARVLYLHAVQQKRVGADAMPPERQQAIDLFRTQGDALWLSRALRQSAVAQAVVGPASNMILDMLDEAARLLRGRGPSKDLATALAHAGGVQMLYGNLAAARALTEEALAMRQRLGDRSGVLASQVNLAELQYVTGEIDAAIATAEAAAAQARQHTALATLALTLANLAGYRLARDQAEAALETARVGLRLCRDLGQAHLAAVCQEHAALACALLGELELAARLLGHVEARYAAGHQTRDPMEASGHIRLQNLLRSGLERGRLRRLLEEGAALSAEEADLAARAEARVLS